MPKKLVLAVIDAMKPAMLERAIAQGRAPALAVLAERGCVVEDCVAAFPSVTPVCSASIVTGAGPDQHRVPSMNWFSREEDRYVEYGTSFRASQAFGIRQSLTDTIYNMNLEHLSAETPTVFERLDDAGVRTAGTTYLMWRGRHRHEPSTDNTLSRIASTVFPHAIYGPREFFYADLFASRRTKCFSTLGKPGLRDQHAGCVGAYLVENDLFDFLLLSLPDNDTYSHKRGVFAQPTSIGVADKQIERMMHAAGGVDEFLDDHAVIVCSDHSQSQIDARLDLHAAFSEWRVRQPAEQMEDAEIAVCPASRAAEVYILDEERREELIPQAAQTAAAADGVDIATYLAGDEAVVLTARGELRFAPGGELTDLRGATWSVEGEMDALALEAADGRLSSDRYPDALSRIWSSLKCPRAGEVQLSAGPGREFVDWGGADHVGGGSHGSLHANDSLGSLLWCGTGPERADARAQWSIRDVLPMIAHHFGHRRLNARRCGRDCCLLAALVIPAAAGAQTPGSQPAPSSTGAATGAGPGPQRARRPRRQRVAAAGPEAERQPGDRAGRPGGEDRQGPARVPGIDAARVPQGDRPVAGLLLRQASPAREAGQGDRPGAAAGLQRRGARVLDRVPGRVDDGARLPGRLRAQGERAVRVDPAVPAVPVAVPAPAAADAASGPAGAAGVLDLLRVLLGGQHRRERPARLSAAAVPGGADDRDRGDAVPARPGRRRGLRRRCGC